MRHVAALTVVAALAAAGCGRHPTIQVNESGELAAAVAAAPDRATIRIGAGDFDLGPSGGLSVSGKSLNLVGAGKVATRIVCSGGEGILFEKGRYSALQDLAIAGAGVTVRGGQLTLVGVRIAGGIDGLVATDGARVVVRGSEIVDSTSDGIIVRGGASAAVEGSLVDGVDGGGGKAIRVEEGSSLSLINSVVRRHLEGIEIRTGARAEVHGNVLEEMGTWGFGVAEGARVRAGDNIIYRTGGCGSTLPLAGDNIFLEILGGPACAGTPAPEPPVAKICGNLPGLPYGTVTSLYSRFCYDSPVMSPS